MQNTICKCDVCGAEKGEANGWFAVLPLLRDFSVEPWSVAAEAELLEGREHICGADCLHKRLNQWLETQNTPPEKGN